jgi:hypothetical protein
MDDARSAHLPLAKGFRLRGIEADGVLYHVAGRWVKVPAEERGWSLTLGRKGLSGLPHHQKPAPNAFAVGWSIYPPSPIGVPLQGIGKKREMWLGVLKGLICERISHVASTGVRKSSVCWKLIQRMVPFTVNG